MPLSLRNFRPRDVSPKSSKDPIHGVGLRFRNTGGFRDLPAPILGVLMALAGVGWLIVLSPLAGQLSTYLQDPWLPRGSLADAVAHRERSGHAAMEGAGLAQP